MLKIAIVDDSPDDRKTALAYIKKYFENHTDFILPMFFEYGSGEEFLADFAPRKFDIIVLDIYMNTLSGMEAAKYIRETDKAVCLIFLTTSKEHVYAGYSVQALGYVPKPLHDHADVFANGLDACIERLWPDQSTLTFHVDKTVASIPLREILYADCQLRDACLHLSDGRELTVKESIREVVTALLCDNRFLECHRNTVVNMAHIRTMNDGDFQLKNGEHVPFALRRRAELRRCYMDFFIGNGRV